MSSISSPPLTLARPFLKWAGGKGRLLAQFEPLFPTAFRRYIEPFTGSGAVFFHLWNTGRLTGRTYLLDNNPELVNAYLILRDELEGLVNLLASHKANHDKTYYYQVRALDRKGPPLSDVERAARTIYLNKTCYNGLYRVNSKGQFNVPMGRYKNPKILDEENLRAAGAALQGVHLEVMDFRELPGLAQGGDFFYFDPPYHPLSKTASFTSYTPSNFGEEDQRDLARVFAQLTEMGCHCMLSNAHTPFILDLYSGFRIETVYAPRAINSKASRRGKVKEVVVLNT